ncbi:SNF2 family N-terminal domain-containing protein, partial [Paraphysoderma sedebokerense]
LRVILDEGHIIRNRSTRNHKAACELEAERKWVLTGTPIHNRLDDLHSLFRFIGTKPFDENDIWRRLIDQPIKSRRQVGMERLRNLMAQITLRRTKSM